MDFRQKAPVYEVDAPPLTHSPPKKGNPGSAPGGVSKFYIKETSLRGSSEANEWIYIVNHRNVKYA